MMGLKKIAPIVIIVLLFAVGIYFLVTANSSVEKEEKNGSKVENNGGEEVDYLSMVNLDESPSLGDSEAPVTMVNYSSYYCPFCSQFKTTIFPEIKEQYIDTGKLQYFYKDAGSPDDMIFLAAHCATPAGLFWDFQDIIIEKGVNTEEDLYTYAEELGLDMDEFATCLDEKTYAHLLETSQSEMDRMNVQGIPYFIVNGESVSGLSSFEEFANIIEEELSREEN